MAREDVPSAATVMRWRWRARVVLRAGALVLLARVAWDVFGLARDASHVVSWPTKGNWFWFSLAPVLLRAGAAAALLLLERRLVAWLIPVPWRGCPGCGYAAEAGRCPECGLRLGEGAG